MIRSSLRGVCLVLAFAAAGVVHAQQPATAAQPAVAPKPDLAADTFRNWDKDGSGDLSLVEFRAGWQRAQQVANVQMRLRQQFGRVDLNDDNAIDASEYAKLVLIRNAGTAAPPMARFDTNANGTLEFGEYAALVRALTPKPQPRGAGK